MKNDTSKKMALLRTLHLSADNQKDLARFKKAAKTFSAKATGSQKKARDTLVSLGTHTRTGRLNKNYK
jgi:hypothetical protein